MKRYRYTHQAEADLDEITEYYSDHSPEAGVTFFNALEARCRSLATSPRSGRDRPELGSGIRAVVVAKQYVVFFRSGEKGMEVLRVLHGSRDIGPEMFE